MDVVPDKVYTVVPKEVREKVPSPWILQLCLIENFGYTPAFSRISYKIYKAAGWPKAYPSPSEPKAEFFGALSPNINYAVFNRKSKLKPFLALEQPSNLPDILNAWIHPLSLTANLPTYKYKMFGISFSPMALVSLDLVVVTLSPSNEQMADAISQHDWGTELSLISYATCEQS